MAPGAGRFRGCGLHLDAATEETIAWTAERLRAIGVDYLLGAHCTGFESFARFLRELGLDRAHAVVGAVGCQFELGKGIDLAHAAKSMPAAPGLAVGSVSVISGSCKPGQDF